MEIIIDSRLNIKEVAPDGYLAFLHLGRYVHTSGFEPSLINLVRLRASQVNGCAYCIDAHSRNAQAQGETDQRLYALSAWRLTPFYSDRERSALAWAEALSLISENNVPDDLYDFQPEMLNRSWGYFCDRSVMNLMAIICPEI